MVLLHGLDVRLESTFVYTVSTKGNSEGVSSSADTNSVKL